METPQVPDSARMRFRARLRTRWSDEDNHGVVNNAVFLTLLEEARLAYFGGLGLLEENRFPFVLAHVNVLYLHPGRGGAEVEVAMRTVELGRTSFTQVYRITDTASGAAWCEAVARLVCVDARTGAKTPMSARFRAAIEALEG